MIADVMTIVNDKVMGWTVHEQKFFSFQAIFDVKVTSTPGGTCAMLSQPGLGDRRVRL